MSSGEASNGPVRTPSATEGSSRGRRQELEEEEEGDEVEEQDPGARFSRYAQEVGKGRFKHVYKGFDEKQGIDVAWSKVMQQSPNLQLDDKQMQQISMEMSAGIGLEHPNIIKCYKCWEDYEHHCINLVTEYFTSGSLRDYRQRHKHLEMKAVKKWARQILLGLNYLHSKDVPIIHGDLRLDKIYINGHSGEIKIGDLGLATLLPQRFPAGVLPGERQAEGEAAVDGGRGEGSYNQYTKQVDIFAFGLCMLELVSLKKLDKENSGRWPEVLEGLPEGPAKAFIAKCLAPPQQRPAATELLEDSFFKKDPVAPSDSKSNLRGSEDRGRGESSTGRRGSSELEAEVITCEVGTVRGEDYSFQFSGKIKDGKLHFRLHMEYEGDDEDNPDVGGTRTIDFDFDPDVDTADEIAKEIGDAFNLSSTDCDICAAALKEWLGREVLPDDSS